LSIAGTRPLVNDLVVVGYGESVFEGVTSEIPKAEGKESWEKQVSDFVSS
jgi:hypothetical protein